VSLVADLNGELHAPHAYFVDAQAAVVAFALLVVHGAFDGDWSCERHGLIKPLLIRAEVSSGAGDCKKFFSLRFNSTVLFVRKVGVLSSCGKHHGLTGPRFVTKRGDARAVCAGKVTGRGRRL
jgi:hypothetical protein